MSILEHLLELRNRLIICAVSLLVTSTAAGLWLYQRALNWLLIPYCEVPAKYRITSPGVKCSLLVTGPLDAFAIRIELSLALGFILALPVLAFHFWRFITPGLNPREKRYAFPFAIASTLLFATGIAVVSAVMPKAVNFLATVGGTGLTVFFAADRYLRFMLFMGIAFGVMFEFPLVLIALSLAGVLSSQAMLRAWRPAVVGIIIVSAVGTPSQDPFSLFAMAIPLWFFYFAAIGVTRFLIEPARARRQALTAAHGSSQPG